MSTLAFALPLEMFMVSLLLKVRLPMLREDLRLPSPVPLYPSLPSHHPLSPLPSLGLHYDPLVGLGARLAKEEGRWKSIALNLNP